MGRKPKVTLGPGQALIKQRSHATHQQKHGGRPGGGRESKPLESIIDVRDLDEVMEQAELAGRIFSALNPLPELLVTPDTDLSSLKEKKEQQLAEEALHQSSLTIPRRPKWHASMSAQELDVQERQSFLTWRRGLARLEDNEKLVLTPFEKNLDIWRQLWRVLERCDLVVMVVDARNPLFYRCPDLEAYVKEMDINKKTMLLLNKADLLPSAIRAKWARYLKSQGISYLFWSAKAATALLEGKTHSATSIPASNIPGGHSEEMEIDNGEETAILGREDLLDHLQKEAEEIAEARKKAFQTFIMQHSDAHGSEDGDDRVSAVNSAGRVVVGFVGYPNVGKSSTINALVGEKKTGVTSTPGKTKHFQTLIISDRLMLCDCPGLVFPSFTSSRSDMVAAGVLPIDRMTDHRGPIQVVASQVPRATLESLYGIVLPPPKPYEPQNRPPLAAELLRAFAQSRGQVASSGLPDETRASRQILKDYLSGKLLYCHLPPNELHDGSAEEGQLTTANGKEEQSCSEGEDCTSESDSASVSDDGSMVVTSEMATRSEGEESGVAGARFLGVVSSSSSDSKLPGVFSDLDTLSLGSDSQRSKNRVKLATHKLQRKAPRKKDRSWRVGNDGSDGMPLVRAVQKPVSYGAAQVSTLTAP